jgi:hypothetical protein
MNREVAAPMNVAVPENRNTPPPFVTLVSAADAWVT